MVIYGLALMSACLLIGMLAGQFLGHAIGIGVDVGGIGIAMLLLVLITGRLIDQDKLSKLAQDGIKFWTAMYIPIVVAMSAGQNVAAVVDVGLIAVLAGMIPVLICYVLIRPIAALAPKSAEDPDGSQSGGAVKGA